jgi:6-phosphofructokinase 1
MLGMKACQCALDGETGVMAVLKRIANEPYEVIFDSIPVSEVANKEKKVPREWINEEGNDITKELWDYMYPLIQGEPSIVYENGVPKHLYLY